MVLILLFYYTQSCIGVARSVEELQARIIVRRAFRAARRSGFRRRLGDAQHCSHLSRVDSGLAVRVVVEEDERLIGLDDDLLDSWKPLLEFSRGIQVRVPVRWS